MKAEEKKLIGNALKASEGIAEKIGALREALLAMMPIAELLDQTPEMSEKLQEIQTGIQATWDKENEYFEGLSEKKQESYCDEYDSIVDALDNATTNLQNAIDELESLRETLEPCLPKK